MIDFTGLNDMADGIHLVIDGLGAKHSGAATVLKEVVRAAQACNWVKKLTVLVSPKEQRHFILPENDNTTEISETDKSALQRLHWLFFGLSKHVRELRADALLCLGNGGIAAEVPTAVFIQQSLPFEPKALMRLSLKDRLRMSIISWTMRRSCKCARGIFVQSETIKNLVSYQFRVPKDKIEVFPPSVNPDIGDFINSAPHEMKSEKTAFRLLYVGNLRPYKNIEILLRAVAQLRADGVEVVLFITCPATHSYCRQPGVVGIGYLKDASLWGAYQAADALVMPSITETVGLPMLEAASQGTPVIAADMPYAHDTCGEAALFFDPFNPEDLIKKIKHISSTPQIAIRLATLGKVFAEKRRSGEPYLSMVNKVALIAIEEMQEKFSTPHARKNSQATSSSANIY